MPSIMSSNYCGCHMVWHVRGLPRWCIFYEKKEKPVAEYVNDESAWGKQEGGSHYKDLPIQPSEYILRNGLGWLEGNVIKYVTRYKLKGGEQDLKKARHYLDLLIEEHNK